MTNELIIQKLKELQAQIPNFKAKHVPYRDTPEFRNWQNSLEKWLKIGLPCTDYELQKIKGKYYSKIRLRVGPGGYDADDEQTYQDDLDITSELIKSAIENLELGLMPEEPKATAAPKANRSRYGGVSIAQVGTVVMGDSNLVNVVRSITVTEFLDVVAREIEKKVDDPEQKTSLLQKLKEISKNPTVTTILGQTLGQVLKSNFGS